MFRQLTIIGLSIEIAFVGFAHATETSVPFINADIVHAQGITGRGVTVVVIDNGVDLTQSGLAGSLAGGAGVEGGWWTFDNTGENLDGDPHGTIVSLIITDSTGVAPDAKIYSIRVSNSSGQMLWEDVIEAIKYAVDQKEAHPGIRVINLSLSETGYLPGCPCDDVNDTTRGLAEQISDAAGAGIITFASTGNSGVCGGIPYPACISSAVPVAASYDASYPPVYYGVCGDSWPEPYRVTCFSNISDNCDTLLAAPGYGITVGGFVDQWGTSFAAPHCSGVAALMFEKSGCGVLDAYSARNIIYSTAAEYSWAYPWCPSTPEPKHVDAWAAVNATPGPTMVTHGDLDCDGTVSGDDFVAIVGCITGPNGGPVQGFCVSGDFPESPPDGDIDLRDFAYFQRAFTGYGEGACCHYDATCIEGTVAECRAEPGAAYQGHGTTCAAVTCPLPPWGACCNLTSGECTIAAEDDCVWSGGAYQGDGSSCVSVSCPVVRYDNTIDPLTVYVSSPTGILADDATLSGSGGGWLSQYTVGVFGGYGGSFTATVALYTGYPPEGSRLIAGTQRTFNCPDSPSPAFLSPVFDPPIWIPHTVWIRVDFSNTWAGWFRAEQAEVGFTENYYARYDPPWNLYWWGGTPYAGLWATIACVSGKAGPGSDDEAELPEPPKPRDILIAPPSPELRAPVYRGAGSPLAGDGPRSGSVVLNLESPSAGVTVSPGDPIEWSLTAAVSSGDNAGLALVSVDLEQDTGNPELFDLPPATIAGAGMAGFDRPAGIANPGPGGVGSAFGGTLIGSAGALNLAQIGGAQNTFGVEGVQAGTDIAIDQNIGQGSPALIAQGSFLAPSTPGTYSLHLTRALANVLTLPTPPPQPPDYWPVSAAAVTLDSLSFTVGEITCTLGDLTGDGAVNGVDIQPFVTVFLNPGGATPQQFCAADMNEDDIVNSGDVSPFVAALLGAPSCPAGDMNNDGAMDGLDIQGFVACALGGGPTCPCGDFTPNGMVDLDDLPGFIVALLP